MSTEKFTLSGDAGPSKKHIRNARVKRWQAANKDKVKKYKTTWNRGAGLLWRLCNGDRIATYKAYERANRYGLSRYELQEMIAQCEGICPLCKRPWGEPRGQRPNVDHCHETGVVRGIICGRCNLVLGHAEDDAALLRRLADYLESVGNGLSEEP
jgi:hypothetical protein